MKTKLNAKHIPWLIAALGIAALILRLGLYLLGTDEKGLLVSGHVLDLLVWVVAAAAAGLTVVSVLRLEGSVSYEHNFGPSRAATIGAFALAGGIAVSVLTGWSAWPRLELICNLCGVPAAAALIGVGLYRGQGKKPFFLLHGVVCVYLMLYNVSHYQRWCSRPQLQDYAFAMGGAILLTLFAYHQTAFDAGLGKRRSQLITGLLAAFFCLGAVAGGEDVLLYLGGAAWALTNLCSLTPVKRRRRNPVTETAGEETP